MNRRNEKIVSVLDKDLPSQLFILAIDGLEIQLVEEYSYDVLKQAVYHTVDVSNFKSLLTPQIWASFITGVMPEEHGIKRWWRVSQRRTIDTLVKWVKDNLFRGTNPVLLSKMGNLLGLREHTPNQHDIEKTGYSTIFDYASDPIALFIPSYNEPTEIRRRYRRAMNNGISTYERTLWNTHRTRVDTIFSHLEKRWDLFMAWLDIADQISHIYDYTTPRGKAKFKITYFKLKELVKQLKKELPEETLLMIVSDHGVDLSPGGHHSGRAFFSVNKEIDWRPTTILDYAPFIKAFCTSS